MNIKNGIYIKANIIELAPSQRTYINKQTGETFKIYTLVVDEGGTSQKKFIRFNSQQLQANLHVKLSDEKYKGKSALIPVWCSSYKDRVQFNYSGQEMPLFATAAGANNG